MSRRRRGDVEATPTERRAVYETGWGIESVISPGQEGRSA
jgi:hypothetical protein